ncbi:MAG: DNA mismatch repair protein MutS [Phycisphaerales bacterium]|nr:DNA mismatch repair protein MutS [Phycisphaerales bacterium]
MSSMAGAKNAKKKKDPRDTPAMRQYRAFKEAHPDCVLFFRMGDFYEMFDDDALVAHRTLGITLTERTTGLPMAGVPFHAAEGYLRRMMDAGHRVAVCEQVQDPAEAKGVVDRAVTRVLTPGTLVDDALLDAGASNIVAALDLDEQRQLAHLSWAELSTGRFELATTSLPDAADLLARIGPSELLVSDDFDDADNTQASRLEAIVGCPVTRRAPWTFHARDGAAKLREHHGTASLRGWGLEEDDPLTGTAGALLTFLQDTQCHGPLGRGLRHLQPPRRRQDGHLVEIDGSTLRSLEIEKTVRSGGVEGSLLETMQCCVTPMGRRTLREWLCFPLRDLRDIHARHDTVGAFVADEAARLDLREALRGMQDVARIGARASLGRATPRDAVALGRSITALPHLLERLDVVPPAAQVRDAISGVHRSLQQLGDDLRARCQDDAPAHLREGGLFRDGVDGILDECRSLQRDAAQWLAQYQARLAQETGISSLKVGYNRVFGYYIEVTNVHAESVPGGFVRKQTLKNAERYITDELKSWETRVMSADARAVARERELFAGLVESIMALSGELSSLSEHVATLDVLLCFADLAARRNWTRPEMTEGLDLEIIAGRHPVLDERMGGAFVPNDCAQLDGESHSLLLITGPNMAGKSTWIRQVALITIMAQAGSFVPADTARIGVVDQVFARIGAADELHEGMSTFMVEMTETANILHNTTERSLVILDEIGRGTSTLDGLSLAWAITESLAATGCRTLFATHYHELTDLADRLESVGNRHVAVQEWKDQVVFLHRIEPGRTNRSWGVHVGALAGLPEPVLQRARAVLESLEVHHAVDDVPPSGDSPAASGQMNLFKEYVDHPALTQLRALRIESMTPLQAFDTLRSIVRDLEST